MRFIFDGVGEMGAPALLARLRLVSELGRVRKELLGLGQGVAGIMQRLGLIKRANQIRTELGALAAEQPGASLRINAEPAEVVAPRAKTAHLYQFHEKRTKGQRQKANDAAIALLNKVNAGEMRREDLTNEDRAVLAGYTGNGGALIGADGKKGSAYEYYTPKPIAEGIWGALGELGFAGGKVLDPCAGVGIFGATAPLSAAVDAVELDATSGGINALVNDGASYSTTISPFERVAAATPDEIYDAVVSNVPFGTLADRGGNQNHDPKYQRETLEAYFILRSLDKLKPGGLAAFLVPPRCTSGKDGSDAKLRQRASLKAEFIGAYRLPNKVFGAASADTITDVIFFRKYSRQAAEKIEELKEQDPAKLAEAKVLWDEYLEGKYFSGEGRRFVLGEFTPKDPSKFRDVDKVSNPASIPDIAKMLRRLPKSRVDWGLLEAVETQPIIYAEGDTITQAGQTLQLQAGQWVPLKATGRDSRGAELLASFRDPYSAFDAGMSYSDAETLMRYMQETSQTLDIPGWLASTMASLKKLDDDQVRAAAWQPVLVGQSVAQVLDEAGRDSGADFSNDYPQLSAAMKSHAAAAKRIKGLGGIARAGLGELGNHYNRKRGFSPLWRGDVQSAPAVQVTAASGFEGLLYENKSSWAGLEQARALFGADFDPLTDDDWCLSADGSQVSRADDYFVGNYGSFCARIDREMAEAPNEQVRAKLMRQKALAAERIDKVDVRKITFNLFSPYVTIEEKAEFLRRFVHPSAVVVFNERTGEPEIDFDIPGSKLTDREKLVRRLAAYLKNGTLTLGGVKLSMKDADAIKELRGIINAANEQFNGWARGNVAIIDRLESRASDPDRLRFSQPEDESPLPIPGMNPELTLHGYQNAEVRKRSRDFSGINGFDVGLGKTFTALALVQYVQSIGVKKKTVFVVPNSVLSNWRKEAQRAYVSIDDCLFVGLREDDKGSTKVSSSNYDEDLNRVMENRHSKIYMTMEAFERIRLKDSSIADYEQFMRSADASFAESEDRKADERAKGKAKTILSILGEKAGAAPYLEDMGIDSLVIDEAHCFPAGTLVDGVPIENIKVGDSVRSFNHATGLVELRQVTDVMRRRAIGLVRVRLMNGQSIVCTHDHEFFVNGAGYVAAEFLSNGYDVAVNYSKMDEMNDLQSLREGARADKGAGVEGAPGSQGVLLDGVRNCCARQEGSDVSGLRAVRSGVRTESCSELESGDREIEHVLLRPVLLDGMAARQFGSDADGAAQRLEASKAQQGACFAQLATNASGGGKEPASQACQGLTQGACACCARREWQGNGRSAASAFDCAAVGDGVCCENGGDTGERNSLPLPAGYCAPPTEDCCGGGRAVAQVVEEQGIGREEGCALRLVGVDSVEVLEHGGDGEFGGVCPGGYVYDITVDGNHNFFAEGILVHNCFKNSASTVDFSGGKYLSLSPASKRGLDAQAKAWLIRGGSDRGDGVLLLTATPITNSPLEIYSMMSLAVGHGRVNDMFAGTSGADGFMDAVCSISNEDDESLDGQIRAVNVFQGLNNAEILRGALGQVATIKSAKDVGGQISIPDAPERAALITLPEATVRRLEEYKQAYRYAADEMAERNENRGDPEAFERVSERFGESLELVGHPFNLINKMTMLIADPDLDQRLSRYVIAEGQQADAQALADAWNAKKFAEDRSRPGPNATAEEAISRKAIQNSDKEVIGYLFKMPVKAWIEGATIALDTISPDMQERFEEMAEKAGVALDVSVPPKLAALLENVQIEAATPRGVDENGDKIPYAKQIIFCDLLGMHNKIKRLLSKRAGIPASAIAIITGQRNNTPDEIMEVQNGFNAPGEANKYRLIIANEKAEVGINLQKGTQAIHHLTIGWTPDSLTQRNGRGVRQGNKTQAVTIYHYDADGTFDTAKRSLVNSKADWIGSLMSKDGGDSVAITGGMSREQMEALIDAVGDADAVTRIQEAMAAKEAEGRATSNRGRQRINLDTIAKQNEFLGENARAEDWIARKVGALMTAMAQTQQTRSRLANPKASESARAKNEALLAEQEVRERGIERLIEEAAAFWPARYDYQTRETKASPGAEPLTPRALVLRFLDQAKRGENRAGNLVESLRAGRVGYGTVLIEINPDAELVNDWEAEISMAKSMREQAVTAYKKQATNTGALPANVAEAFARGEGLMIGDVPVIAESFIIMDGVDLSFNLMAVGVDSMGGYTPSAAGLWKGNAGSLALSALVPVGRVVYPGSAEYEACLTAAAAYEDAEERAERTTTLFTKSCPQVATRRETEALASYSPHQYQLPAPYFPVAVDPGSVPEGAALLARIVEEQAQVIRRWEGGNFVVPGALEVEPGNSAARHEALRDYAIAHSARATAADFGGSGGFYLERMIKPLIQQEAFERLLAGDDGQAIRAAVEVYVRSLATWFDFAGTELSYLDYSKQAQLNQAVARAGGQPAAPSSSGSPADLVEVSGKTMDWKDRIKSYALRDGQKAKWNGRRECWSMRRAAWEKLIADFPRAAEDLRLLN